MSRQSCPLWWGWRVGTKLPGDRGVVEGSTETTGRHTDDNWASELNSKTEQKKICM